jgi:hypothetical protein
VGSFFPEQGGNNKGQTQSTIWFAAPAPGKRDDYLRLSTLLQLRNIAKMLLHKPNILLSWRGHPLL